MSATAQQSMVSWQNVSKDYPGKIALQDFSLELGAGVHCLLGANGAGKSTALNILCAIRAPSAGAVFVLGHRVRRAGPQAKLLACVPQALSFPPTLKVFEVLRFIAVHYPDPLQLSTALECLELDPVKNTQCGSLSGGQLRRLGIAAALLCNAQVMILDEPLAGLDIAGRDTVRQLLFAQRQRGRCIIMASHDYAEIEATADAVTLMKAGRCLFTGSTEAVRDTLNTFYLSFNCNAEVPVELKALGAIERLDEGRFRLTTRSPDEASRLIIEKLVQPKMQISKASLEDAVKALLDEAQS